MPEAFFGTYNARFIDVPTVGERFVMRETAFKLLAEHSNALLLGPRGSGKTTLLKMLKISAQAKASQQFFKVFKQIKYTPAYVGADRQFELLVRGIPTVDDSLREVLAGLLRSLMAIRTQFALLDSVKEITDSNIENVSAISHQFVPMSRAQEQTFASLLNRIWGFETDAQNLVEVRAELWSRIQRINAALSKVRVGGAAVYDAIPESLLSDPLMVMSSFVDAFEEVVEKKRRIWCLCVDELEIMPADLQDYFLLSLRSTDQRILLKLATSPYTPTFDEDEAASSPMYGHDFTVINLTDRSRAESNRFVKQLVGRLVEGEGLNPSFTPEMLLGRSPITDEGTQASLNSAYRSPSGAHYRRFKELVDLDESFFSYLSQREIDIESLNSMEEGPRAAAARKIIWPVALRIYFGTYQKFRFGTQTGLRSTSNKRIPPIYTGSDAIISMCDGNPRVTIGLFRDLIAAFKANQNHRVSTQNQSRIVESAIGKFLSLLSAIPAPSFGQSSSDNASILELLQKIGTYVDRRNFGGEFTPDMVSTFVVDDKIPPTLRKAIGRALNQGAFVMIENATGEASFGAVAGSRLRLSFLLCPYFKLPLTVSAKVNLSSALSDAGPRRSRPPTTEDLFGTAI
ncbi:hypothetical protein X768_16700 [Mesorhizobium sp. LSJC265A00]|uniref:ORC-CDC6 family AAA ATPase n=1 Tax=Mesorhizobium sp. LSJC265A00 TaxID=1287322 RepID=UPI0003CF760A|nr:ATP-binding protein [Mesorhizobium sp. LSJC265A00]ESX09977.1 hypothetical protein X768_16700 [Mesorhizobium sp. LSJC265A00]